MITHQYGQKPAIGLSVVDEETFGDLLAQLASLRIRIEQLLHENAHLKQLLADKGDPSQ